MKKLALAAAFAGAAGAANAAGLEEPIMDPGVIVDETEDASTVGGLIVPLILIALVAAALTSGD